MENSNGKFSELDILLGELMLAFGKNLNRRIHMAHFQEESKCQLELKALAIFLHEHLKTVLACMPKDQVASFLPKLFEND